jgi:hypothetical protein
MPCQDVDGTHNDVERGHRRPAPGDLGERGIRLMVRIRIETFVMTSAPERAGDFDGSQV